MASKKTSWTKRVFIAANGFSPKSQIMALAHSVANARPAAVFAKCFRPVKFDVLRVTSNQNKVSNAIVVSDSVDMVNNFPPREKSANGLFHFEPMLKNITSLGSIGVILGKNLNIPVIRHSLPISIIWICFRMISYVIVATDAAKRTAIFCWFRFSNIERLFTLLTFPIGFIHANKSNTVSHHCP